MMNRKMVEVENLRDRVLDKALRGQTSVMASRLRDSVIFLATVHSSGNEICIIRGKVSVA
jgi:hypothetical protein